MVGTDIAPPLTAHTAGQLLDMPLGLLIEPRRRIRSRPCSSPRRRRVRLCPASSYSCSRRCPCCWPGSASDGAVPPLRARRLRCCSPSRRRTLLCSRLRGDAGAAGRVSFVYLALLHRTSRLPRGRAGCRMVSRSAACWLRMVRLCAAPAGDPDAGIGRSRLTKPCWQFSRRRSAAFRDNCPRAAGLPETLRRCRSGAVRDDWR